ncbi:MAG TPA: protein translocase subunit SecF [Candidatus Paceibacterota bacterium]
MFIVKNRKIFYAFSILMIALSFASVWKWGLNFGIDFTGGSVIEVSYADGIQASTTPSATVIRENLINAGIGESVIRQIGDQGYIIRTPHLDDAQRKEVVGLLGGEIKKLDSVGPVLGRELQGKAAWSIGLVLLAIVLFITFTFRKVSRPVASWKYGSVAIIALLHDVIVPIGLFAFLGRAGGFEIDALFITALLVILGFSIHDTIVVFDRTRENLSLPENSKKGFDQIVGESLVQTVSRSINTTLTTVLALLALYFFGPETTRNFSLALIAGIGVGVYSSVFIASPLLVTLEQMQAKKASK